MNLRERKAISNIKHAANWILGGLENTLEDYSPDDDEYKSAKAILADHKALVKGLYTSATTAIYNTGCCYCNPDVVKQELRDINFLGKEWLMNECEKRITKEGY